MSELLVSPRFCPFTRRAVLVESHEVSCSSLSMLVEIGRIRVVPVLLELLTEDTFCCEFLLRNKKHVSDIIHAIIKNTNRGGQNDKTYMPSTGLE